MVVTRPVGAADTAPAAPPVGIVFALGVEADAFERGVEGRREFKAATFTFHTGAAADRRVVWCVCGVGAAAAAAATRQLISGHAPRCVISAGFAGGLDPGLARGAVVHPSRAVTDGGAGSIDLPCPRGGTSLTIVTVTAVAATVESKRALAARTGGHVVDMETHAVATAAAAAGLPCWSVRVVSDDANQPLPREVAALAAAGSPLRTLGTVIGALGRRPAAAADLWRLWEHAVVDSRTLAAAVVDLIAAAP